jgi:diguanylate cyclase
VLLSIVPGPGRAALRGQGRRRAAPRANPTIDKGASLPRSRLDTGLFSPLSVDLHQHLAAALACSELAAGLFDADERLRWANPSFRRAFAVEGQEFPCWEAMMRRCHAERVGLLIEADDIDAWLARVRRSFRKRPHRHFESDLVDGRWMSVTETLLDSGWVLVVASDITALKHSESTLRHAHQQALQQSMTDSLTGLHNRRFIFDRLDELLAEARSMRFPLACAMLDLDHFKRLNDEHGHTVGDQVLVHFAEIVRPQLRPFDLVGRVGGEEFLIVFPNSPLEGASRALLRLHRVVAEEAPVAALPHLRYTFSSGLALAEPGDSSDQLFHRADMALYQAKAAGRGLCVVLDGPAIDPRAQQP